MMRTINTIILLILFTSSSGCSTVNTLSEGCPWAQKVYSGTYMDTVIFRPVGEEGAGWYRALAGPILFFDLPFSFIADTALLPVTIPWAIVDSMNEVQPEERKNHPCIAKKNGSAQSNEQVDSDAAIIRRFR
jgi:uncharacterized protein YceK